jgi:hypothetical protein
MNADYLYVISAVTVVTLLRAQSDFDSYTKCIKACVILPASSYYIQYNAMPALCHAMPALCHACTMQCLHYAMQCNTKQFTC